MQGAYRTLCASRPVILAEVQDARTRPWGYAAQEIIDFLLGANYRWFALTPGSKLQPLSTRLKTYDANLVALPAERADQIRETLAEAERREAAVIRALSRV